MKRLTVLLLYFARTTLRGLRGSPVTTAVAILTISVSLVLVGAFDLLLRNMEDLLDDFGRDLHVTAYLEDGLADAEAEHLAAVLLTVEGVESVRPVSKDEALERFKSGMGADLLDGLDENPLPASIEIQLLPEQRTPAGMRIVVESIRGLPGIGDLGSGQDWVEGYLRALAVVRGIGVGLSFILAFAALLIVTNTIRLAVFARRDELDILRLVGASRAFTNTPFIAEGIAQGAAGGSLAVLLLFGIFHLVLPGLEFGFEVVLGSAPRFFHASEVLVLIGQGAALGLIGSVAALIGNARP
ncbi:MAG: ABC transporter permease [Deltaproteobacteria bacterium]|nr:ABC transporter permease [Deltaproteobacteria bacterium]MBW2666041.1 ABC transporter permease [Deltaproteobacteria bacterium]